VPEKITLKVLFHGTVPGLSEHRLSLGAFAEPLANLLKALRRIANTRVTEALGRNPSDFGRLPEPVRQLDIELANISEGSSGFVGQITFHTPPGETMPLFDIADRSANELLEAIDEESRGNLRNAQVRTYLKSIPPGVTRQSYVLSLGEKEIKKVEFGTADLAAEVFGLPYLMEFIGRVTGVGFEPGRNQVRFQMDTGQDVTVGATHEQVDYALENRASPIRVMILESEIRKLLWLQLETDNPMRLGTESFIFNRWEGLLRRLANEADKR
jgi:hypothetical protein